jgi:hypothetical protein
MAIGKIKASRVNNVDAPTYVGEQGILFYNFANGVIRLSDGVTPGGVPVPYNIASDNTIGGIKAGPGANISIDGTLTIDTAGLPLSIGNLSFIDTTISTLNPNVDLSVVTNGTGNINIVGGVNFFKPGGPIESGTPFFKAKSDGQLTIFIPVEDPLEGGVEIIGSASGNYITPGQPGTMLQITGNPEVAARVYIDGNSDYVSLVARRFNGNVAVPTQVLAGQDILRINSTAATSNGMGNIATAQIRTTALENQTPTAQGSSITFTVTPIGSSVTSRVDVANITVANGVTATKFTTTGNVTAGNIIVAGSILGNAVTTVATIGTGNIATLNVNNNATINGNIRYNLAVNNATATQLTSKATPVTCDGRTGQITTHNGSIAKGSAVTFTVNNSYVTEVTDVPIVVFQSGATIDSYSVSVTRVQIGSFDITITNNGNGPLTDTIVINFAILKVG